MFVLVTWTLSATMTFATWAGRRKLRQFGAAAERGAVELVAVIPVLFALALVMILAVRSYLGVDHCELHRHHVHLCLMHGSPWAERVAAVMLVTAAGVIAFTRCAVLAVTVLRGNRAVARLRRASDYEDGIWWVDTTHALCFVAGFRNPKIFISTGARASLDHDERAAMLAHERAHVLHRDVARRLLVDLFLIFGATFASRLRRSWNLATERLCDARAAGAVGSGEAVASAMVKMCRLGVQPAFWPASFTPPDAALAQRVHSVLAREPPGDRAAQALLILVASVTSTLVLTAAFQAESLHHLLESLLG
jgi:Peptidase family M48